MKTNQQTPSVRTGQTLRTRLCLCLTLAACALALPLRAATAVLYTNDFESYTAVATGFADTSDADPTGSEWALVDDTAWYPMDVGAGVQVISWLTNRSGEPNQCLLLRPHTEADVHLPGPRSGSRYQLDFWTYAVREPSSSQNFLLVLRGEGSDFNGDDYLGYRVDRATNSTALFYYDGVGPSAAAWKAANANQATERWQHHRLVIEPNALTFSLFVDDMSTPVLNNANLARSETAVPTLLRIVNEANSSDDGYFAIDDISFTVEDSVDLTTTFTEGFETYPARLSPEDDADPLGPWITTETDGTSANGAGRPRAPVKVQVVGRDVIEPHSGNQCLKLQYGQRAGASLAWGAPPRCDVQVTWWARVPASVLGQQGLYLRLSLYGAEDLSSFKGDAALLAYGSRQAGIGDATSLLYYPPTGWSDSALDYTPDTWEEYRLITHTLQNQYSLIKNPSGPNPQFIVQRGVLGGNTTPIPTNTAPVFMAAWSSSNGTNHPPVYVDDIEIKSLVSSFAITSVTRLDSGFQLNWQPAGAATYRVQRGPSLDALQDITENLTVTTFTDTNNPGNMFYRVVVKP